MPFDINHESEVNKINQNPQYASEIDVQYGITHFQLEALRLISKDDGRPLTEPQKELVEKFVLESMGNMELNGKLKALSSMNLENSGLSKAVINRLVYFSFKTRGIQQFSEIEDKVNKMQNQIENNMTIDEKHQISLREYSIFTDMVKTKENFDFLRNKIGYNNISPLGKFHQSVDRAAINNKKMEDSFSKDFKAESGMLAFDNTEKKKQTMGKKMSLLDKITKALVTSHGHVSKLYLDRSEKTTMAHINPFASDDQYSLRDFLYSDIYKINLEKLISEDNKELLKQTYGENWLAIVQQKYAKIEMQIHEDTFKKFAMLTAKPAAERKNIGVKAVIFGYKKSNKTDFLDVHKNMIEGHYKRNQGKMLCSEFIANTTIATIIELNNRIAADASFKGIQATDSIIDMPISKKENLSRMHPDRFLKVLAKKGCLETSEQSLTATKFFKNK